MPENKIYGVELFVDSGNWIQLKGEFTNPLAAINFAHLKCADCDALEWRLVVKQQNQTTKSNNNTNQPQPQPQHHLML